MGGPDDDDEETGQEVEVVRRFQYADDRAPWEKQPGEGTKAFEAFALYRDLSYGRSIAKAAKDLGKSQALLQRWSSRNEWAARRDAYDLYRDRRDREAREGEQDRARRLEAAWGAQASSISLRRLRGDAETNVDALDPNELSPADAIRMGEAGMKATRNALGMATDLVRGMLSVPGVDVARIGRLLVEAALVEFEKPNPSADAYMIRVEEIGRTGR